MRLPLDRVRFSYRALLRHRRFSALAILSLALAIALNTTMYSVLDALINPKVAIREPKRLFALSYYGDFRRRLLDQDKYEAMRSLGFVEGMTRSVPNYFGMSNMVERGSRVRDARVLNVSPNYFALLGNQPSAGRLLSEADLNVEPRSVVMSERLWKQLFPERETFDTATILLNGQPRSVIGLLPYEADFPGAYTDMWQLPPPSSMSLLLFNIVRLRPGVTLEQAHAELDLVAQRLALLAGESPRDVAFRFRPIMGEPFRFQRFHFALIGAVLAVLLVACFNLANLQLARGITRSRELATRAAIGASRADIIAQLILESAWLAGAGLLLGLILTVWGMKLVEASVPPSLSHFIVRPQASWRLFAFAAIATIVCLGFVGLVPAIKLSRVDINELLKSGSGTGVSRKSRRQYGALVVAQIGLALALLVGAALLLRTASGLYGLEISEHYDRIIQAWVNIGPRGPADRRTMADVSADLVARARALKTVVDAATIVNGKPKKNFISLDDPGGTPKEIGTGLWRYRLVSSSYLRTFQLKILKGRDFQEGEFAEPLVIVDDLTARYLWPGADPLGRLIKMGDVHSNAPWLRVIGVVQYKNLWAVFDRANPEERLAPRLGGLYVLNGADSTPVGKGASITLAVRGTTNLSRLVLVLQNTLTDGASGLRPAYVRRMFEILMIDRMREKQNFIAALFVTFALLALAVSALGVYAIVSHSVSQRTREFGVRIALGAGERDIRQSVLQEGNVLALSGIAVGLILAARAVGLLSAFLRSEEDRYDSWLFGIVALALFAVTLLASYVPARRAMRINPVEALRND
ncbi:MAG TPA: FtsX-like permease family protein [Gemmatimonadaceae bacterium]|jgi:predicted permease